MPTQSTEVLRRIVLRGLIAEGLASETTISLVDDAGMTLYAAPVNEDGSCEVPAEALASAHEVLVGPVSIRATEFRERLDDDSLDVAAPHARPLAEAASAQDPLEMHPPNHPDDR